MKKNPCGIVVDASVARAAGTTDFPTSRHCRDFLFNLRDADNCYCVFSHELGAEWKKHASLLSTKWRTSMYSRRRVIDFAVVENGLLRGHLNSCAETIAGQNQEPQKKKIAAALAKDAHLLEAALQAGNRVASLDETVRNYLRVCTQVHADLKRIVWVNPDNIGEETDAWIKSGAPLERGRMLGHQL
jgi:hypothetical protein